MRKLIAAVMVFAVLAAAATGAVAGDKLKVKSEYYTPYGKVKVKQYYYPGAYPYYGFAPGCYPYHYSYAPGFYPPPVYCPPAPGTYYNPAPYYGAPYKVKVSD